LQKWPFRKWVSEKVTFAVTGVPQKHEMCGSSAYFDRYKNIKE
jgi:hypothetical protein